MLEKITTTTMEQKEISIFRTSVINKKDIAILKNILDLIVGKSEWNFDLEDVDKILRIHSNILVNGFLIQELKKMDFECEELF